MASNPIPQLRQRLARCPSKPQEWSQLHTVRIELQPNDTSARPADQVDVDIHFPRPREAMTGLELDMPRHAVGVEDKIIATSINLRPQDFDVPGALAPQMTQHVGYEQMLQELLA